jgi:predicted PurR-regulated permease PerM
MTGISRDLRAVLPVLVLALACLILLWPVLDMIILGASLAVVLLPFHHRVSRRIRPLFSTAIITGGIFAGFVAVAYGIISILRANTGILNGIFGTIGTWLANPATSLEAFGLSLNKGILALWLSKGSALFLTYWTMLTSNLPFFAFRILVFFLSFSILLLKGEDLKRWVIPHLPAPVGSYIGRLTPVTTDALYVIYIVQVAIAILTFFISVPVFYLLGYGHIFFYSFLAAFCELIPILGSSVAFILMGAYAFALGDMRGVLILLILGYFVVSALPEISVRPVLVGRRVRIHPLIMFVGIIGGLLTMGLAGFVLGPLIIIFLIDGYRIWREDRRQAAGTTGSSGAGNRR